MLSFVFDVEVQMVDDCRVLLVEFDAAFRGQLLDGFSDVGGAGDEDVAAAVDEARDGGDVELTAKGFDRRSEDDEVVVEKLAVFDQR